MYHIVDSLYKLIHVGSGEELTGKLLQLNESSKKAFLNILKPIDLEKGQVIHASGNVAKEVYFIESGLIVATMEVNSKEIGMGFYAEGAIGGDIISFLTQKTSSQTVRAIEKTKLYSINFEELDNLFKTDPKIEHIGRLLYNYLLILMQDRIQDLVIETAQSRYENFQAKFPNIYFRLPLNFTASYLGITQETLSRIRSKR